LLGTSSNYEIAAGADGSVWITESSDDKIARVTPNGTVTEFLVLTAGSQPFGIAAGPDGALWFTERKAGKIGKLTPPPPSSGGRFHSLTPCRVADTRNPDGPYGGPALAANKDRLFTLTGRCGIPSNAQAVALNTTVTGGAATGQVIFYPAGADLPLATSVPYGASQTRANNAVLGLGTGGALFVHCAQPFGTVHVIVDVSGYFQ
jgi:hypothetical protein